jgi:hypothetical protein
VTARDVHDFGYTEICAGLFARFGTRFGLETIGECTVLVGKFEGGIEVMITDCGVTLSPVEAHLNGRAAGYYVGVHAAASSFIGGDDDRFEQLGYACDVEAPPTVEAIGDLVHQALGYARFLGQRT